MILGCVFDAKMGGLDKPKQAFRIIFAAKYEFTRNCEIEKNAAKKSPRNYQHLLLWWHRVGFLRSWSVLEECEFLMIFDWPKVGPENKKTICGDVRDQTRLAEPRPRRGEGGGKPPPRLG